MAAIVGVHGIAQEFLGEEALAWCPPIRDGLRRAGVAAHDLPSDNDVAVAFWGDLFRPTGKAFGTRPMTVNDIDEDAERELLELWWHEAAATDAQVLGPDADTKVRTPQSVQRALLQLSRSSFFAGLSERAFIGALKQVVAYFRDSAVRAAARERVTDAVGNDTRVVVGHSLGSVIAYEALCAHPDWPVSTLVTLGSPLGIPNVVFQRLEPRPHDGKGRWPTGIRTWVNIADQGDVVALRKQLAPIFDGGIEDALVVNGAKAHDVRPYLTAMETGAAIRAGLDHGQ